MASVAASTAAAASVSELPTAECCKPAVGAAWLLAWSALPEPPPAAALSAVSFC
jgi:hypothetical protein